MDASASREGVPLVADASVIVGEQDAATLGGSARAGEGLGEVESAVVVGQLFAGLDVADGDLEVVADGEAVGGAGVVIEAGVVPAEDVVAVPVDVRVPVEELARVSGKLGDRVGREALVEYVERPGDGAARDAKTPQPISGLTNRRAESG